GPGGRGGADPDPLQRGRPRHCRVRDRPRRGARRPRAGQGGARVGGRDTAGDAGLPAHRVGVCAGGDSAPAHRRRRGGVGHVAWRGRSRRDRRRPDRRQRRHRQQDRYLFFGGARGPPQRAVLCGSAVLDHRPRDRLGRPDSDRGARCVGGSAGGGAAEGAEPPPVVHPSLRRHAGGAHRGDRHRARRRASAVPLLTAREYHDRTVHSPASVRTSGHTLEWDIKPFPFKVYSDLAAIPLPREIDPVATDTLVALAAPAPAAPKLGLGELAAVLYYTAGVTKKKTYPGGGEVLFRAAASTGALFQTEVYVAVGEVASLEPGLYHFCPGDFALRRLRAGDVRAQLAVSAADDSSASRAATVLLTGIYWRNAWKYQARAYRHLFWDSGTMLANLLVVAGTLGFAPRVLTGFVDDQVNRLLGVDPAREAALELVVLGPDTAPAPPGAPLEAIDHATLPLSSSEVDYPLIRSIHSSSSLSTFDAAPRTPAHPSHPTSLIQVVRASTK